MILTGERSHFDKLIQPEIEDLITMCNLTPREKEIFEARAKGASVIEACFALSLSERTIVRDSASIRRKIARAQHHRREPSHACNEACN